MADELARQVCMKCGGYVFRVLDSKAELWMHEKEPRRRPHDVVPTDFILPESVDHMHESVSSFQPRGPFDRFFEAAANRTMDLEQAIVHPTPERRRAMKRSMWIRGVTAVATGFLWVFDRLLPPWANVVPSALIGMMLCMFVYYPVARSLAFFNGYYQGGREVVKRLTEQ